MEEIRLRPIGIAHTLATDDEVRDRGKDLEYTIDILPEFADGLEGMDGFSHLIVLFHFDKLRAEQKGVLKVRPKKFLRRGLDLGQLPTVGVFALDSPSRPNPIGFSAVKVLKRDGPHLVVRGLEAFDATPVIDIKPYTPERRVSHIKVPTWYSALERIARQKEAGRQRSKAPRRRH